MPESQRGNNFFKNAFNLLLGRSTTPEAAIPPQSETPPKIESVTSNMKQMAEITFNEFSALPGKKGLVLLIDDNPLKIDAAKSRFTVHKETSQASYLMRHFINGNDGIDFYIEFREVSPDAPVFVLMDGDLGDGIFGDQVVKGFMDATENSGLAMPYILSNTSHDSIARDIEKSAGAAYIGNFTSGFYEALGKMDTKL